MVLTVGCELQISMHLFVFVFFHFYWVSRLTWKSEKSALNVTSLERFICLTRQPYPAKPGDCQLNTSLVVIGVIVDNTMNETGSRGYHTLKEHDQTFQTMSNTYIIN